MHLKLSTSWNGLASNIVMVDKLHLLNDSKLFLPRALVGFAGLNTSAVIVDCGPFALPSWCILLGCKGAAA
jgi:hypothetical protein